MRIVDLFSGAGGLTFGFYYSLRNGRFVRNQNNTIVFANEFDHNAAEAFRQNFPDVLMLEDNIKHLKEKQINDIIGDQPIDLIIGGPPCQSYSTIGKRKYDDKAKLYSQFIRMLKIIRPRMFVFENVQGILSMKNKNGKLVINDIIRKFENIQEGLGYNVNYSVLDAVDFGVPQHRKRVFIVGVRNDQNILWQFPEVDQQLEQLTIENAISDLPEINSGEAANAYILPPQNQFQQLMRNGNNELLLHRAASHGDKIQTVINNVIQGEGKNYFNKLVEQGLIDKSYKLTSGYGNTYGRLIANQPCTTITNNLSTPSGLRCIHYRQNRALTPREGARIQSFPDWFRFVGARGDVNTQIGNAVPPLLAMALATRIANAIEGE